LGKGYDLLKLHPGFGRAIAKGRMKKVELRLGCGMQAQLREFWPIRMLLNRNVRTPEKAIL